MAIDGGIVDLTPDIPAYEGWSTATGINDCGLAVSFIDDTQGFVWPNGTQVMLGDPDGGGSRPADINKPDKWRNPRA